MKSIQLSIYLTYFCILHSLIFFSSAKNSNSMKSNSKEELKEFKCGSLNVTGNGNECIDQSNEENDCCYYSKGDQKSCFAISKNSKQFNDLKFYNGTSSMQFFSTSPNSKDMEVRCNRETFSDFLIQKANKCSNVSNADDQICSKFSDEDIQCCHVKSNNELTNTKFSICSGNIFSMKLASYALKYKGVEFSFLCNLDEKQRKIMQDCANVIPNEEKDCDKKSQENFNCRFAFIHKQKICVAINGNVEMMKDFKLSKHLNEIDFPEKDNFYLNHAEPLRDSGVVISISGKGISRIGLSMFVIFLLFL